MPQPFKKIGGGGGREEKPKRTTGKEILNILQPSELVSSQCLPVAINQAANNE